MQWKQRMGGQPGPLRAREKGERARVRDQMLGTGNRNGRDAFAAAFMWILV